MTEIEHKLAVMLEFEAAMILIHQHRPVRNRLGGNAEYECQRDQDRFVGFCASGLALAKLAKLQEAIKDLPSGDELRQINDFLTKLNRERNELIAAAQAVIDRWDTPLWKDAPATAEYIARLRKAVTAMDSALL